MSYSVCTAYALRDASIERHGVRAVFSLSRELMESLGYDTVIFILVVIAAALVLSLICSWTEKR